MTRRLSKKLTHEQIDIERAKAYFGGAFPRCAGRKYRYPRPENERAWAKLVCAALNHRNEARARARAGLKPQRRNYKYETVLFHCRDEQRQRRAKRGRHRRELARSLDLGGKHVHHLDRKNLRRPVVLSERAHHRLHASE